MYRVRKVKAARILVFALLLLPGRLNSRIFLLRKGAEPPENRLWQKQFVPASTLKILTSLVALKFFGRSYRFKTDFYIKSSRTGKILIVKGYGDPLVTSEVLKDMACKLKRAFDVKMISKVVLDTSYLEPGKVPGVGKSLNPYDAPCGAISLNFNTVNITFHNGIILSAEPQTPLIPFIRKRVREMRIRKPGRYSLFQSPEEGAVYFGKMLLFFLGLKNRSVEVGKGCGKGNPMLTYISPFTLEDVVKKMMRYSNNLIANQLLMSLGARIFGPPGNLEKGKRATYLFLSKSLGVKEDAIRIVEGSGISRKNLVKPWAFMKVLRAFYPYRNLLRKRRAENFTIYYKTGTLKGIRNEAGYINCKKGEYIFLIVSKNNAQREKEEKKLIKLVTK